MRQLVLLLVAVTGCGRSVPHVEPIAPGPRLESGDRVVARIGAGFQEATVMASYGKVVSLTTDAGTTLRLPRTWVTPLIYRDVAVVDGEWRLCEVEQGWAMCRPERSADGNLDLTYVNAAGQRRFADSWTLEIPSGVATWAVREGGRRLDRALLSETLPGVQPATVGARVAVGEPVVARWNGGGWWDATVRSKEGERIVVAWLDGSAPSTLTAAEVAPAPSANRNLDGRFVLCRYGSSYTPAMLAGAPGSQRAVFADGRTTTNTTEDCIPGRAR
jgi:hypothetical protein